MALTPGAFGELELEHRAFQAQPVNRCQQGFLPGAALQRGGNEQSFIGSWREPAGRW